MGKHSRFSIFYRLRPSYSLHSYSVTATLRFRRGSCSQLFRQWLASYDAERIPPAAVVSSLGYQKPLETSAPQCFCHFTHNPFIHYNNQFSIMSEQEKSILSQLTLDSQSSFHPNIPSIHAGEPNYQFYKYSKVRKAFPKPLSFGSSSSRVAQFLHPVTSSDVVSYAQVYPHHSNHSTSTFQPPFGSNQNRFSSEIKGVPGPGSYDLTHKPWTTKEGGIGEFGLSGRKAQEKDNGVGPGTYNLQIDKSEKDFELRCKLKQMLKEKREKQAKRRQRSQVVLKMPEISKPKETGKANEPRIKGKAGVDRFWLKQNTQKYLQHSQQNQLIQIYQPVKSNNLNFSPAFVEKNDNPFHSYLQSSCSPPPTRYLAQISAHSNPQAAHSSFTSKVERQLFKLEEEPKQKPKLSWLL